MRFWYMESGKFSYQLSNEGFLKRFLVWSVSSAFLERQILLKDYMFIIIQAKTLLMREVYIYKYNLNHNIVLK